MGYFVLLMPCSDTRDGVNCRSEFMKRLLAFFLIAGLLTSCQNKNPEDKSVADTPTTGEIIGGVDETLRPLIDAELFVFHSEYPKAKVQVQYKPEAEAIQDLLDGKTRFAITTRKLSEEEKKAFEQEKIRPREVKIAIDAVTLITNPASSDTQITMEKLRGLLEGKFKFASEIFPGGSDNPIQLVVDNQGSSTIRHLKDSVFKLDAIKGSVFALKSGEEVIDYVNKNGNCIGLIGAGWISDRDDSTANAFLNKFKVMEILSKEDGEYYKPFQAYLALRSYPLTRTVYYLLREPRTGLGTGFSNFLASDKGQRIVLKSGLVPATMPVRLVKVKKSAQER